ncbi:MAG: SURF1 family protein [Mycobacterium sp.]
MIRRWAGWLALTLVVAAFAYLCFTVLAPWQLGKNTRTTRENHQIEASLSADPVPVTTLLPQQDSAAPDAQWRRVTATGHFLPAGTVLARLRVIEGSPAFEVLTPFAVQGGPTVLVNRGYVRPVDVTGVPAIPEPPAGTITVTGRLRDSETAPTGDKQPFREGGFQQVYAIDTRQVAQLTRTPLTASYLQLIDGQPGGLGVLALPQLDAGPFLSYGIQWIAFGIVAPIGLGYFVLTEIRTRRREDALRKDGARKVAGGAPPEPVTTEEKLADRYGRRP